MGDPRVGVYICTGCGERVRVDDGVLIVDTSMPGSARCILDAVESLGYRVDEVRGIVLTHWHPDHMGSAQALRQATGAPISIHELDAPVLARRERPQKGRRAMGGNDKPIRPHRDDPIWPHLRPIS